MIRRTVSMNSTHGEFKGSCALEAEAHHQKCMVVKLKAMARFSGHGRDVTGFVRPCDSSP